MKKLIVAAALFSSIAASASATPYIPEPTAKNSTMVFGGIQWNFGSSAPELVLGLRTMRSTNTSSTFGAKFDVTIPMDQKSWMKPTIRILGVGGSCDVQAETGFGLNLATQIPVFALGVQAPYTNAGFNYSMTTHKVAPYFGRELLS